MGRFDHFHWLSAGEMAFGRFLLFLEGLEGFLQMVERFLRVLQRNVMVWDAYSSKPLRFLAETSQT